MRKRFGLLPFAWALLGLLVLSGSLLILGTRESKTNPSAVSYGPSGTRAFADLLRRFGHPVVVTNSSNPALEPDDLVLGFPIAGGFDDPARIQKAHSLGTNIRRHVLRGGRAFVLKLMPDFSEASRVATSSPYQVTLEKSCLPPDAPDSVVISIGSGLEPFGDEGLVRPEDPFVRVAKSGGNSQVLDFHRAGRGAYAILHDATGATNRFLDKEQNAEFLMWAVAWLHPNKGKIVILEAMHGAAVDPGLLGILGNWVVAGWWQLVFALIVIGFTLGRRFGLPEFEGNRQRSTRELVDAYSQTMSRTRKPQIALRRIVGEFDRLIRRRYNLPAELPMARRNEALPASLAKALVQAELAAENKVDENTAAMLLFRLEDEMAAIDGGGAPKRRRRRRI